MKKRKSVLIIGGTGFLGYHIAKFLLKKKYKVISISLNKPKKKRFLRTLKYLTCDIGKYSSLQKKLNYSFDYVINCGGYVNHYNDKQNFNTHFRGTKNLIKVLKKKKLNKFIHIGSSLEYGKIRSPNLETSKCIPKMSYGLNKLKASKYLLNEFKKNNLPVVILRLYQLYGTHQDNNRFIPFVISSCLKGKIFPCSNGVQKRDFLYVNDAVKAIYKSMVAKNTDGKLINLGFGKAIQIKKIIQKIRSKVKKGEPKFGVIKMRKEEQGIIYPNIELANNILKWKPTTNLEVGLTKTINFYKNLKEEK